MIEFQKAPAKEATNLLEMIESQRKVEDARVSLSEAVETAKSWKALKKSDTLLFGLSTLMFGGAFAGLTAGSTALAETHHIWSAVLSIASFVSLLPGIATFAFTFTRAASISLANTDLEEAKAKLAAFDATPVNELELKEAPTK